MNLRFKLGEMALHVHPLKCLGEVTVLAVGPFEGGTFIFDRLVITDCDYIISAPKGFPFFGSCCCLDRNLIKRGNPDATETIEEDAEVHA
jgi:hypothetical protein